jgi:hypothetical protein
MTQSAALLILPARERTGEETDAARGTTLLLRLSQEDLCLAERVESALRTTGYGPCAASRSPSRPGFVILGGRVPGYSLKQVARATAVTVTGAHQVRNDLDVGRPS